TVKGARLIQEADLVLYAGSLVNPELLNLCSKDARLVDSAGLDLKAIIELIIDAARSNKKVVRLQTGDPTFYSALQEQTSVLEANNISYEVIPGVSSAFASAAALKKGLTMPEVTQTIILTRLSGRTPVPVDERLAALAAHKATLCIFLSISMIEEVVSELTGPYPSTTPAAVVYRATWPDELIIRTTLEGLTKEVKKKGITKHAMILVGPTLGDSDIDAAKSKLYDSGFSHGFREVKPVE
ncbi:MAG: precorrin-4 C(11)-methyltransferase, partial [Thermodesulfobacteriota bacterium]